GDVVAEQYLAHTDRNRRKRIPGLFQGQSVARQLRWRGGISRWFGARDHVCESAYRPIDHHLPDRTHEVRRAGYSWRRTGRTGRSVDQQPADQYAFTASVATW